MSFTLTEDALTPFVSKTIIDNYIIESVLDGIRPRPIAQENDHSRSKQTAALVGLQINKEFNCFSCSRGSTKDFKDLYS